MKRVPTGIWWGTFEVAAAGRSTHDIGPLRLTIERTTHAWQIIADRTAQDREAARAGGALRETPVAERFAFEGTRGPLHLKPVAADRPVVVRPSSPFYVAAGGATTIYISSPVWVRIEVGKPARFLQELYVVRSSDTWFGPSTLEGDLCYASRTAARMTADKLPRRPERALTAAHIRNHGDKPLLLERLSLPAVHLALYAAADGALWTPDITLVNTGNKELSGLTIADAPPRAAPDATLVAAPRSPADSKTLVRAFASVFK